MILFCRPSAAGTCTLLKGITKNIALFWCHSFKVRIVMDNNVALGQLVYIHICNLCLRSITFFFRLVLRVKLFHLFLSYVLQSWPSFYNPLRHDLISVHYYRAFNIICTNTSTQLLLHYIHKDGSRVIPISVCSNKKEIETNFKVCTIDWLFFF